ncbi:hypothetical protein AOQ84DRAFT_295606 [Glonium stellatum]|uniref:Uncharacterized protein n=1 Tax=Glonium stellatum TaxID=574774 RepID=A0A8E2EYD8_9PEZI|nr:hypothetical protein AOQ84DRAFT_295606 [Glonium stellatum]
MAETFPDISSLSLTNSKPLEFSFSLPHSPQTNIHLHLTNHRASLLIFLTTASTDAATTAASLGSFVYAMPNRTSPSAVPLSTPLYTHSSTLDFATRLAKALARRVWKPVYVGNSISFANTGMGGAVEEEMEGFRRCVEVIVKILERENGEE